MDDVRYFETFPIHVIGHWNQPLFLVVDIGKALGFENIIENISFVGHEIVTCNSNVYFTDQGIARILGEFHRKIHTHVSRVQSFNDWRIKILREMSLVPKMLDFSKINGLQMGSPYFTSKSSHSHVTHFKEIKGCWLIASQISKILDVSGLDRLIREHVDECNRDFLPVDMCNKAQWIINFWGFMTCLVRTRAMNAREIALCLGVEVNEFFKDCVENRALRPFIKRYKDQNVKTSHPLICKKGIYIADMFIEKCNTVVEVDEPHHRTKQQIAADKERQLDIVDSHKSNMVRISPKIGDKGREIKAVLQIDTIIEKLKCQEGTSENFAVASRGEIENNLDDGSSLRERVRKHDEATTSYSVGNFTSQESWIGIFLALDPIRINLDIRFVPGKVTPIKFMKTCFTEFFQAKLFPDEETEDGLAILLQSGLTIVVERICKACSNIAKCEAGNCSHCHVNYRKNVSHDLKCFVGIEVKRLR